MSDLLSESARIDGTSHLARHMSPRTTKLFHQHQRLQLAGSPHRKHR
jgi:hypothetical protein